MSQATAPPRRPPSTMTHRQILEALSGLLLGMFVAILSSTVVSNALPRIITELHGGQSAYTWVVTSALLATTATTPIWGKLADLTSKKTAGPARPGHLRAGLGARRPRRRTPAS